MGREVERKFLLDVSRFEQLIQSGLLVPEKKLSILQGYLSVDPERTVRVRITETTDELSFVSRLKRYFFGSSTKTNSFLTIKSKSTPDGLSRNEWEYQIDNLEAVEMISNCIGVISKERFVIGRFEVDFFRNVDVPAVVELELKDESEIVDIPEWVGVEVTGDSRYYNSKMIQ